jgi:lipopolysaccharide biosynthesis regulator YciM
MVPFRTVIIVLAVGFILGWILGRVRKGVKVRRVQHKEEDAYTKGLRAIAADELNEAAVQFRKTIELNPNHIGAYLKLGDIYRAKGNIRTAIKVHEGLTLRETISDRDKVEAYSSLGLDYERAGLPVQAIWAFKKAIELDKKNIALYRNLERICQANERWTEAYPIQKQILKLGGSKDYSILAHIKTEMGKAYFEAGDIKEAIRSYRDALGLNKECIHAMIAWGDLYLSQEEPEKAIQLWTRVIDVKPQVSFLVYERLEGAYYKRDAFEKLISKYKKLRDVHPDDVILRIALGDIFYKQGLAREAIVEYKEALRCRPGYFQAHQKLGKVYLEQNMTQEAVEAYRNILQTSLTEKETFSCQECGYESDKFEFKCPSCGGWDTFII